MSTIAVRSPAKGPIAVRTDDRIGITGVGRPDANGAARRPRLNRRNLIAGGAILSLAGSTAVVRPLLDDGRVPRGTVAADVAIGGLDPAEALRLLRNRLARFEAAPVVLRLGSRSWSPTAADLGIGIDYAATIDTAMRAGRSRRIVGYYAARLGFSQERSTPVEMSLDSAALDDYLQGIAGSVSAPARDARLLIRGEAVVLEPGADGVAIDTDAARRAVVDAIAQLSPVEIDLPTIAVAPRVIPADLEPLREASGRLIGSPVAVVLGNQRWEIAPAQLASALVLPRGLGDKTPALDPTRILPLLDPIAAEIDHPAVDATLGWDQGIVVVDPGYAGAAVDRPALARAVVEAAETDRRIAEVPIAYAPAAVSANTVEPLGITSLLATGTSSFAGSSEARAANVAVATDHVSRTLTPPGGVFSFNDALGPITTDHGYVKGKIIQGDWYASDLGGGVCQVSTTVFRAALLAGLPFLEWHPHSFRLPFYELDGWAPGMDAAIYQSDTHDVASLDLRFANPTDGSLFLQVRVTGERVVAELYGPTTGYEVEIGDPEFGEPVPAPEPIERQSTELEPGSREEVQIPQPGVTVRVRRRVLAESNVVSDTTFVSPYRPQPQVILVGDPGSGS